jgi:hypothetical protein
MTKNKFRNSEKVKKKEKEKEGSYKFEGVNSKEHSVSVLTFLSF